MNRRVPDSWLSAFPKCLVVGNEPYAAALATALGAAASKWESAGAGPQPNATGRLPRVLDSLERVIVVAASGQPAAEVLRGLEGVWAWIEKLSGEGPEHEAAFLLVASPQGADPLKHALAVWLGVSEADLAAHGHAVCGMGMPLAELITIMRSVVPCDRVRLQNRRRADLRRRTLDELSSAVQRARGASDITTAATAVVDAFKGSEHDLDLFCRPPSHANGNRLRGLLKQLVTEKVTPDLCREVRALLPDAIA